MNMHVSRAALATGLRKPTGGLRGIIALRNNTKSPAELIADLNRAFDQFKAANDERLKAIEDKGSVDVVLNEKVDRINADITRISNEYKAAMLEIEKKLNRLSISSDPLFDAAQASHLKRFNMTLQAHAKARGRERPQDMDRAGLDNYRAGFDRFLRVNADQLGRVLSSDVMNVMQVGSDPDGGMLCPPEMEAAIDKLARDLGAMRSVAAQRTIGGSSFKKRVQTSGAAAGGWGNERTAPTVTDTPRLAELEFTPGTLWAEPEVTTELLEDASIDIESYLAEEVGITFGEQEEDAFVDGNGTNRPRGVLSYDTVDNASWAWGKLGYVVTGAASSFATSNPTDALLNLVHSLKRQYRANAAFQMNDTTLAAIRKFKDGDGNYMWVPDIKSGVVGVLFGFPVVTNDFWHDLGANDFPVGFGDWRRGYLIVDRRGTVVLRDPFTAKPYVLFWTTRRVGGGVQNFQAIKLLKCST